VAPETTSRPAVLSLLGPLLLMTIVQTGWETAHACLDTFYLRLRSAKAWAALSTSGMAALVLPPVVRMVVILTDHDASGAGERAARTAAARWLAEGRRVRIAMPLDPGTDFADVLIGQTPEVRDIAAGEAARARGTTRGDADLGAGPRRR
jgi:hypothetical protein